MKIAWGVLVGDARGKTGNICATWGRSGPVLRRHFRSKQPNSQTQLEMRAALSSLSVFWSDPSMAPYRPDWIQLALAHPEKNIFNADIYKTGLQWFIRANKNRATIGEPVILQAPAFAEVDDPAALTLEHLSAPPEELNITASSNPVAGDAVVIFATRPLSPGIFTLGHQQRLLKYINPATASPWDIFDVYTAKYGTPPAGKQIFVEVWYTDIDQGMIGLKSQAAAIW
jgi:hypothetical protein